MSSARAVRCRLKCHNERNPCGQLPSGDAGDSARTAAARCEEGGDDVKSARPLRPGLHTCYNGRHSGRPHGDVAPIPKTVLSSDWSLQPDSTKLDSLVIAHQPWRGEYVPRKVRLEHLLSGPVPVCRGFALSVRTAIRGVRGAFFWGPACRASSRASSGASQSYSSVG